MRPRYERPPHITISVTNNCNLRCRWCYGDCGNASAKRELSTKEWLSFVDYLVDNDFIQIYFEGGEPLLRPDFRKILKHCAPKLMTFVRTNGTLVTDAVAGELKTIGVGRVLVDIMGGSRETHDDLTGVGGSFEKSCAAVRRLVAAGLKTDVLVILNRKNAGEIQALIDLTHGLGALRLGILRLYPLGRAKRAWSELALSLEEQHSALASLQVPHGFKVMQSWHPTTETAAGKQRQSMPSVIPLAACICGNTSISEISAPRRCSILGATTNSIAPSARGMSNGPVLPATTTMALMEAVARLLTPSTDAGMRPIRSVPT